jgi:hypothetical protein
MGESAVYTVTLEKIVAVWRDPGLKNHTYICFARLEKEVLIKQTTTKEKENKCTIKMVTSTSLKEAYTRPSLCLLIKY